jgi:hypothetical protein
MPLNGLPESPALRLRMYCALPAADARLLLGAATQRTRHDYHCNVPRAAGMPTSRCQDSGVSTLKAVLSPDIEILLPDPSWSVKTCCARPSSPVAPSPPAAGHAPRHSLEKPDIPIPLQRRSSKQFHQCGRSQNHRGCFETHTLHSVSVATAVQARDGGTS